MDRDLTYIPKSVCYYLGPWLDTNYWEVKQPSREEPSRKASGWWRGHILEGKSETLALSSPSFAS